MNIGSINKILKDVPYKSQPSSLADAVRRLSMPTEPKAPAGVSKGSLKAGIKKASTLKRPTPQQAAEGAIMPEGYNLTAKAMPGTLEGAMAEWDADNRGVPKTSRDVAKYSMQSYMIDGMGNAGYAEMRRSGSIYKAWMADNADRSRREADAMMMQAASEPIGQAGQAINEAIGDAIAGMTAPQSIGVDDSNPTQQFVKGAGSGAAALVNPLSQIDMISQAAQAAETPEAAGRLGEGLVRPVTVWFDPKATPEEKGMAIVQLGAMLAPVGIKGIPKLREVMKSMPSEARANALYDQLGETLLKNPETAESGKALIAEKYRWDPPQAVEEAGPVKTPVQQYVETNKPKPVKNGKKARSEDATNHMLEVVKNKERIADNVLNEYKGAPWADAEIARRANSNVKEPITRVEADRNLLKLDTADERIDPFSEKFDQELHDNVIKAFGKEGDTALQALERAKEEAYYSSSGYDPQEAWDSLGSQVADLVKTPKGTKQSGSVRIFRKLNGRMVPMGRTESVSVSHLGPEVWASLDEFAKGWNNEARYLDEPYATEYANYLKGKTLHEPANRPLHGSEYATKEGRWDEGAGLPVNRNKYPVQLVRDWLSSVSPRSKGELRRIINENNAKLKLTDEELEAAKAYYRTRPDESYGKAAAGRGENADSGRANQGNSANQASFSEIGTPSGQLGLIPGEAVVEASVKSSPKKAAPARKATASEQPSFIETGNQQGQMGMSLDSPVRSLASPERGTVPSTVDVAPLPGGTKMGAKELVLDLQNTVGKKIVTGKTGRGAAGQYMPGEGKTVIRFEGDIPTAAHELSHSLDDMFSIGKDWHAKRAKSPFDKELFQPAFMQSTRKGMSLRLKRAEAIAEWVTAYVKNPAEAERLAPQFAKHFKSKVPAETLSAIDAWSENVRKFAGETSLERTRKQIQFDEPSDVKTTVQKVKNLFTKGTAENIGARKELADDLAPLAEARDALTGVLGIESLPPSKDPYILARGHRYEQGRFNDMLENGVRNMSDEVVGIPIADVFKYYDTSSRPLFDIDFRDSMALGVSKRVIEKAGQALAKGDTVRAERMSGAGGGLYSDIAEANATIAELQKNPERYARLEKAHGEYKKWARSFLDYAVEKGLLSKEQIDGWIANNEEYVAMHRIYEEMPSNFGPGGRRIGNPRNPVKKFSGSTRKIENPVVTAMADAYALVKMADRNEIIKTLGDLIGTNEKRGLHEGRPVDVSQIGYHVPASEKGPKLTYFVEGKAKHIKLEPDLMQAMNDMSEVWNPNILLKVLQAPARLLRGAATSSPAFLARNFVRDTLSHIVISEHKGATKGLIKSISKSENSDLAYYGGGAARELLLDDAKSYYDVQKRVMDSIVKDKTSILAIPREGKRLYVEAAKWSEMSNRRTEFNAAYKHAKETLGYGEYDAKLYAGQQARDLQDFMKSGRMVRAINRFVPFTNAKIQGMIRFGRAVKENPAQTMKKALIYTAIPVTAQIVWNKTHGAEKEYDQLPEYQKYMFYNYKIPGGWLRIPKGHEIAALGSFLERSARYAEGETHAFDGYVSTAAGQNTFLDTSSVMPPALQALINKDVFRDRDIVPFYESGKALEYREGTQNATKLGQAVQSVFKIDARKADYLINSYLADWGRTAGMLSDIGSKPMSAAKYVNAATGAMTEQSPYGLRDYQWLSDAYKRVGKRNPLSDMAKAAAAQTDQAKKEKLMNELMQRASAMRKQLEENPLKPSSGSRSRSSAKAPGYIPIPRIPSIPKP